MTKNLEKKIVSLLIIGLILSPVLAWAATTLYADLSASPSSGAAPLNNVSLTATVSGNATGLITYRFDCTSDGTWEWTQANYNSTYTASNLCNYPSAGNYTATIRVERENLAFQGTTAIIVSTQATPAVDLRANGSDGPLTVNYNETVNLSWTSSNATYCTAAGDWAGGKVLVGSEAVSNLTSTRTYTLTCTNASGASAADSVTVMVGSSSSNLYASLEALPNNGTAPLNGVDLRATVTGTASGTINYRFDCTADGTWDYTFNSLSDNPKTVVDACNYQNPGTYLAKVRVERGTANPAEATAQIVVSPASGNQDLSLSKLARNLSDGTGFQEVVASDPGEVIEFRIFVTATGSQPATNLTIKDTLPDKLSYKGNLKVDNVLVSGDILTGLNVGTLNPQQTKTVTFEAIVAQAASFGFGTTDLVNTALAYNTAVAKTATAKVQVTKTSVAGATTIPTGLLDSTRFAFLLSLIATFLLTYFLLLKFYLGNRAYAWGVNGALGTAKDRIEKLLPRDSNRVAEEKLAKMIEEIKGREGN
ncbi:MAG: DUF11 domain-containing protein [Candidatus Nealsonbacteria bacterium]|nr:DUF11 domain-containing protein [Candidatus Nealsonbacteria bacterium]